jgi:GR25 family glycosyltransferase involved in LPS biosynthesis
MKAYVIAINKEESRVAAKRCIKSAENTGKIHARMWGGWMPEDNPRKYLSLNKISVDKFEADSIYSRTEPCIAAFASHYSLWVYCTQIREKILILEHDAVFTTSLDYEKIPFKDICSIGAPSYGKFNIPPLLGVNSLTSKNYLPGAHAYMITTNGARKLIAKAKTEGGAPTDLFINKNDFNVQEYYPWPVKVKDNFSTIQHKQGCIAKHNYNSEFKVI